MSESLTCLPRRTSVADLDRAQFAESIGPKWKKSCEKEGSESITRSSGSITFKSIQHSSEHGYALSPGAPLRLSENLQNLQDRNEFSAVKP